MRPLILSYFDLDNPHILILGIFAAISRLSSPEMPDPYDQTGLHQTSGPSMGSIAAIPLPNIILDTDFD